MSDATTDPPSDRAGISGAVPFRRRLSTKLLLLTVIFVMIAELMIFPPSIGNFRLQWLSQRFTTSAAVGLVLLRSGVGPIDDAAQQEILRSAGVVSIALRDGGATRQLVGPASEAQVDQTVDLRDVGPWHAMRQAIATLARGGGKTLRVIGQTSDAARTFEIVVFDDRLRRAMLIYARNIMALSLIISAITAALVFAAINRGMIRPIRNLRNSLIAFAEAPDDPRGIVRPSGRRDELGITERELAAVQTRLQRMLAERRRLADLGLAVSKINHDMRNILASALLISDRLRLVRDPVVQAFAPKLVKALDRAVGYTQQVLTYGSASPRPPKHGRVDLRPLLDEAAFDAGLVRNPDITFMNEVPDDLAVSADLEQVSRIFTNLMRNAREALEANAEGEAARTVVASLADGSDWLAVSIDDNGPGLPPRARDNLFVAFEGSAKPGGTGLGLLIARELAAAHGGTLTYQPLTHGTRFTMSLPASLRLP